MQKKNNKTIGDCTFGYLWPHEEHICGRGKVFFYFVDDFSMKFWVDMMNPNVSGLKGLKNSEHL